MGMLHQLSFDLDRTILIPRSTVISEIKLKLTNQLLQYTVCVKSSRDLTIGYKNYKRKMFFE